MIEDAWADGVDLFILSPYRSYDTQVSLFEKEVQKWVKTGMDRQSAENKASTIVARPGTSEHHTGLAVDMSIYSEKENLKPFSPVGKYEWINNKEIIKRQIEKARTANNYSGIILYSYQFIFSPESSVENAVNEEIEAFKPLLS